MKAGWILIALFILCAQCKTLNVLYNYQFTNLDQIKNIGQNHGDINTLKWNGGVRDKPTDSTGVILNARINDHYKTAVEIKDLRTTFVTTNGFELKLRVKLETANNYNADYCLFCLLKSESVLNKFNPCNDLDLGVRWKNRELTFNIRTSETHKCDTIEFAVPVQQKYIGKQLDIVFRYDSGKREVYINNAVAYEGKPTNSITASRDVSTWAPKHHIWIGPLKNSSQKTNIQLNQIILGSINQAAPTVHSSVPLNDNHVKTRLAPKGMMDTHPYPKTAEPATPRKRGFTESAPDTDDSACRPTHPPECTAHVLTPDVSRLTTVEGLLNLEYEIYVDATVSNTSAQTLGALFPCVAPYTNAVQNTWDVLEIRDRTQANCNSSIQVVIAKTASIGALYECYTGISRNAISLSNVAQALHQIGVGLTIEIGGTDGYVSTSVPCGFNITTNIDILNPLHNATNVDVIEGAVFVVNLNTPPMALETTELTRYIHDNDVFIPFKTCFNARDFATNATVSLDSISILLQTGPILSIGNISTCDPQGSKCCHFWDLHSVNQFLTREDILYSELYTQFIINGEPYIQHTMVALTEVRAAESTQEIIARPQNTPNVPVKAIVRLYNDPAGIIPYKKYTAHQRIYYMIDIVPKALADAGVITADTPRKCYTPYLAYQLGTVGVCMFDGIYIKDASCEQLGGRLFTVLDVTNPYNPTYSADWQATAPITGNNCTGTVQGSFVDITRGTAMVESSGDIITAPLVHPSFFSSRDRGLHRFQISTDPKHTWTSSSLIGGCPDGLFVDDFGRCLGWYRRGFNSWFEYIRWFALFIFVALCVWVGVRLYACFFPRYKAIASSKPQLQALEGYTVVPGQDSAYERRSIYKIE